MGELHSAHVKMYTKMYMICMYVLCRIVLFYCILWHAIKLIVLIAWNIHKYYIDIVLWTFQDIHRIYPNKLSGSLWHTFLFTVFFCKGSNISYTYVFYTECWKNFGWDLAKDIFPIFLKNAVCLFRFSNYYSHRFFPPGPTW